MGLRCARFGPPRGARLLVQSGGGGSLCPRPCPAGPRRTCAPRGCADGAWQLFRNLGFCRRFPLAVARQEANRGCQALTSTAVRRGRRSWSGDSLGPFLAGHVTPWGVGCSDSGRVVPLWGGFSPI